MTTSVQMHGRVGSQQRRVAHYAYIRWNLCSAITLSPRESLLVQISIPFLRSRTIGQDVAAPDILETAFCETVWKAALMAWDSKHRSCRSPEALISEAQVDFCQLGTSQICFNGPESHVRSLSSMLHKR
jgi:hypothetical protein